MQQSKTLENISREELSYALIGLGFFIDYRGEEGMEDSILKPYMQTYLNLMARLQGRDDPDLDELRSRAVPDTPELRAACRQVLPRWLPRCEKLRVYRQAR